MSVSKEKRVPLGNEKSGLSHLFSISNNNILYLARLVWYKIINTVLV